MSIYNINVCMCVRRILVPSTRLLEPEGGMIALNLISVYHWYESGRDMRMYNYNQGFRRGCK